MFADNEIEEIRGREVFLDAFYVVSAQIDDEFAIEARWYGGATVNVYVDGKEVDCFTRYELETLADLRTAFVEWLGYEFELEDAE